MGKRLFYCGGPGMGLQAKLTQNLILSNILMAFNEGMVLATKGGVDPQLMLEILDNSAAKSGLISYKAPFVFRRDFTPTSPPSGCTRTSASCWTPEKSWVYPYL
jgi:3-hydroxyisobutyrate dehydrogenase-like beta-hydroxyacid dehydrogenase